MQHWKIPVGCLIKHSNTPSLLVSTYQSITQTSVSCSPNNYINYNLAKLLLVDKIFYLTEAVFQRSSNVLL